MQDVQVALAAIDPALAAREPLLQGLLDLPIPDNDLTARFDAKLRKTSLEGLLVDCLRAQARAAPLVLVLEDCHRIDPLSRDLLEVLARAIADLPVLIVLAYRPAAGPGGGLDIERLPYFEEISLGELDHHDAYLLIRARLEQMLGVDAEPPAALVDLVTTRAQGNAFYIEELLNFIGSQGVHPQDEAAIRKLELPESLHSLILSRIDAVGEAPRRTLKVASVVGRTFSAPMLPGVYPELGAFDAVKGHLDTLGAQDLLSVEQEGEQTYLFKHVVTQEVAYESMPFAFRSMLHERVGGFIELTEPDSIERNPRCSPTTSGTARTCARSASTSAGPATRRRRPTPTLPRSSTSSGWPRCSSRASGSTCSSSSARCSSWSATGAAPRKSRARRWRSPRAWATSTGARRARRRWPRWRASTGASTRPSTCSIARPTASRRCATRPASARCSTSPAPSPRSAAITPRR